MWKYTIYTIHHLLVLRAGAPSLDIDLCALRLLFAKCECILNHFFLFLKIFIFCSFFFGFALCLVWFSWGEYVKQVKHASQKKRTNSTVVRCLYKNLYLNASENQIKRTTSTRSSINNTRIHTHLVKKPNSAKRVRVQKLMGNDNKKNSTFPFFAHIIFFFQCFCSLVPIRIYFFFIVSCTESRFMLNTNYQRSAHIKSFLQMQIEAIYLKAYSHVFV